MTKNEIKLKVKLEDIVLLTESVQKLANEVYDLHLKIVNGGEKTPTMENKEERIYLLKVGEEEPYSLCKQKDAFSRAEATERMAKAIFSEIWGLPKNRFDLAKDSVRARNRKLAEAALDALLEGK